MNYLIILAGGAGTRLSKCIAKQHIKVKGHDIIEYTIKAFSQIEDIDSIIVVSNKDYLGEFNKIQQLYRKVNHIIGGGD